MKLAVFATACFAATVQGASLKAFPSHDLAEMEQLEFAQSFDEAGFMDHLSNLAQNDNLPILSDDLFM